MEHVHQLTNFPGLEDIQAHLANNTIGHPSFQKSELYSSKDDGKIIDESLRRSKFRIFEDDDVMFGFVDKVVQSLNESADTAFHYQLRRDNITETRYEVGGHFLKHKDFLSVTSNLVEEFTLILCVTPLDLGAPVQGGETIIYPYASEKGQAFDTATPGRGLLFRKDLEHAGNELKAGEKHILTANIIATRKQVSDQVLFVTFPSHGEEEGKDDAKQAASSVLLKIANQDSSYAIPVDSLKGSMLEAHVRFLNQKYEQNDEEPPKIVNYHCTDFSYEDFGIVAKILLNSYIQEDDIRTHAAAIDYFGPFAAEKLLVNLAMENGDEKKEEVAEEKHCKRFVQPTNVKDADSKDSKKTKSGDDCTEGEDYGVIVCENESRTTVVYEVAQALGFTNYVPFKMVFAQGLFLHGYYDQYVKIPVTPAALVVGDYNHIFGIQNIGGRREVEACSIEDYHTKHNYFSEPNPPHWNDKKGTLFDYPSDEEYDDISYEEFNDEEFYEARREFLGKAHGLGLKLAFGNKDARKKLSRFVLENPDSETYSHGVEPNKLKPLSSFLEDSSKVSSQGGDVSSLFHRDSSGKVTFTTSEADAASAYIASMNLDERVKAAVQKKRFELTQEMEEHSDYYCNESTYANLSILFVTGLVRLDHSVDATSTAVTLSGGNEFNAWPTKQHKKAVGRAVRNSLFQLLDFDCEFYDDSSYKDSDEGEGDYEDDDN